MLPLKPTSLLPTRVGALDLIIFRRTGRVMALKVNQKPYRSMKLPQRQEYPLQDFRSTLSSHFVVVLQMALLAMTLL